MSSLTLRIPGSLRPLAEGRETLEVAARTLAEAFDAIGELAPLLAARLFADGGGLRPYVNLYLDGVDVRGAPPGEVEVPEGAELVIVASIAGGRPDVDPELSPDERLRYGRQLILPGFGSEGQARLREASVLLVGAGGLGSPAALYLAAAGVGRLGIVDSDTVDLSNLHRQVLHDTTSVGRRKVASAVDRLHALNPEIEVVGYDLRLDSSNAMGVLSEGWDLVVDGSDNFPTRYLVNDACVLLGLPCVYGAIFRFEGQASVFCVPGGPCYRCLFRDPPPPELVPSCAEAGVLGVLPGLVGSVQAAEALKLLLATGSPLVGRLLLIDAAGMEFREIEVRRDPECPVCGDAPSITGLVDYEAFCRGEEAVPPRAAKPRSTPPDLEGRSEIDVEELQALLESGARPLLIDVREPYEWEISNLGFAGARLIPLGELTGRLDEIDPERDTVIYCRTGSRSGMAMQYLRAHGYPRVVNLRGGINDWALRVDPSLPRY